jgi:putative membrane protein
MLGLLIKFLVTTVSLLIISKLPVVGVDIDTPGKAAISALTIGVLNALAYPLIALFKLGGWLTALPLFVLNVIIFGLAAALIPGFRLQNNLLSAIFGALLLTIFNSIINHFLPFDDTAATTAMLLSGVVG